MEELKQKLIDETEKLNEIKQKLKDCDPSMEKKQHWVEIHKELRDFLQKKLEEGNFFNYVNFPSYNLI